MQNQRTRSECSMGLLPNKIGVVHGTQIATTPSQDIAGVAWLHNLTHDDASKHKPNMTPQRFNMRAQPRH